MFARRPPALLVPVAITLVLFALDRTMAAAGARPDGAQWVALGVMVGGVALLRPHWLGRGPLSVLVALAVGRRGPLTSGCSPTNAWAALCGAAPSLRPDSATHARDASGAVLPTSMASPTRRRARSSRAASEVEGAPLEELGA